MTNERNKINAQAPPRSSADTRGASATAPTHARAGEQEKRSYVGKSAFARTVRLPITVIFFASTLFFSGASSLAPVDAQTALCADPQPARVLPANDGVTTQTIDPNLTAAVAAAKAMRPDPESANRIDPITMAAMAAADLTEKRALDGKLKRGSVTVLPDRATLVRECLGLGRPSALSNVLADLTAVSPAAASVGPGYAWVDFLNQQAQGANEWCGPATVSEVANTMYNNARLSNPVSQSTAASYMGTNVDGTSVTNLLDGLNNYVGLPVSGINWYRFVWVSMSPQPADKTTFINNLDFDVTRGWPVAGDAWEEINQPHLLNHPPNQLVKHWFEVGGYSNYGDSTYYMDSAMTVWPAVQAYNWFDTWTMILIFGGFGYAW